jgi:hypothetical protein
MNMMEDPMTVVSDLRPAGFDRLAEETYARRRGDDLARVLGEPAAGTRDGLRLAPSGRRESAGTPGARVLKTRLLVTAGTGLAAAAVAAAVLIAAPTAHGHPAAAGAAGAGAAGGAESGQAILLTAAHVAAAGPAATGTYWYVKERDFEPAAPRFAGKIGPKGKSAGKDPGYGASYAATEESWVGASRTRTIVNENLVFGFASAAGEKKWQAAGSPKLGNPSGKFGLTGPATGNYAFGGYSYNIGEIKVSLVTAGKLPTTPGKLGVLLLKAWNKLSEQQRAATVGVAKPTYAQYLFQVAGALLTGPVTPGTRAAVYGLLAKQAGLAVAAKVTDPLGRVGAAIGDGDGDFLIISPATAEVLDLTTYPVRPGVTITGKLAGTEAYLSMGWTDTLGAPARS